jgi:hypothetical protein
VLGEATLRGERAVDGFARAAEDHQEGIADGLDLAPAVLGDRGAHDAVVLDQPRVRARLVEPHGFAVVLHVGEHDGDEHALRRRFVAGVDTLVGVQRCREGMPRFLGEVAVVEADEEEGAPDVEQRRQG